MTASTSATPSDSLTVRAPAMPGTSVTAAVTACGSAVVTMTAGSALPAGKDWARRSLAAIASGLLRNWSAGLRPVSIAAMPAAMTASATSVTLMMRLGWAATRSPTRRHSEWPSARAASPSRGTLGQKIQRSKMTRAAGSTSKHEGRGDDDADGAGEPEAARRREEGEQQGQQADDDGHGARQDGLGRAAQGERHGLAPVGVAAQLVAVAGDEQQGVVGAGAEHEDREDADGRLVPDDREGRERVCREHGCESVRDADDDEREDPEDRAAVGQHEQQGDDGGGGDEQARVGALEDRGEVGLDRGRPGHLGRDALGQVGLDDLADVAHQGRCGRRVRGVDGHDGERGRAVLAALERSTACAGDL